jgi:hypothetical protein
MDQDVRRDTALGHLLVVPLGNDSLGVWISMTNWDWRLSSHKGQWRSYDRSLPLGGIMTRVSLRSARDECGRALVWE